MGIGPNLQPTIPKKTTMQSYTIVGEDNTTMSNKIDIRTESVTVTPMTEQAVGGGNSSNIYGFSDWVLNTPKDVESKESLRDHLKIKARWCIVY